MKPFTVIIITESKPSGAGLDIILHPWRGPDAKFTQWVFSNRYRDVIPGCQARVGDLDFGAMMLVAKERHATLWDLCEQRYASRAVAGLSLAEAQDAWDTKVTEFRANPGPTGVRGRIDADEHAKALQAALGYANWRGALNSAKTREHLIGKAHPLTAFALVKDGQWYERGTMGWFACVSDEKAADQWDAEVAALLDNLPADAWLTVVDCHI